MEIKFFANWHKQQILTFHSVTESESQLRRGIRRGSVLSLLIQQIISIKNLFHSLSFRNGEILWDEAMREYYKDLKALEAEGRYEIVLNQLYVPQNKSCEEGANAQLLIPIESNFH